MKVTLYLDEMPEVLEALLDKLQITRMVEE